MDIVGQESAFLNVLLHKPLNNSSEWNVFLPTYSNHVPQSIMSLHCGSQLRANDVSCAHVISAPVRKQVGVFGPCALITHSSSTFPCWGRSGGLPSASNLLLTNIFN